MHYSFDGCAIEGLLPLSDFLKKMGVENNVPLDKLVVKKEGIGRGDEGSSAQSLKFLCQ